MASSPNCSRSLHDTTDAALPGYSIYEPTTPPPDYLALVEDQSTCNLDTEDQEQQPLQRNSIALPSPQSVNIQSCHDLISFLYSVSHMLEKAIPQALQRVYICRAELRYIRWLQLLQREKPNYGSVSETILPPLDVMLCWYAHMLSPFRYHDDLIRNSWEYVFRYPLPLEKARDVKTKSSTGKDPISERFWTAFLPDEPYELTLAELRNDERSFTCIFCQKSQQSTWSEYARMHSDPCFYISCVHCQSKSSTQTLSCYQFVRDVLDSNEKHILFKGVMLDSDGQKVKSNTAKGIKVRLMARVMKEHDSLPVLTQSTLQTSDACDWTKVLPLLLLKLVKKRMPAQKNVVWAILMDMVKSSYFGIVTPLCIDLVQAVGRQHTFVKTLVATDWQKVATLNFAIRRYGMFLALLKQQHCLSSSTSSLLSNLSPMVPAVPTVDIDLCWNVHMVISPQDYANYCADAFGGHVINHDDMIPAGNVVGGAVLMAMAWYKTYEEPYTTAPFVAEHGGRASLVEWVKKKTTQGAARWKNRNGRHDVEFAAHTDKPTGYGNNIDTRDATIAYHSTSQSSPSSRNTYHSSSSSSSSSGMDTVYLNRSSSSQSPACSSTLSIPLTSSSSYHQVPRSNKEKYALFLETMTDIALHNQDAVNAWYGHYPGATSTAICNIDKVDPHELFFGNYGYIGTTSSPVHVMATKYGTRMEYF